MERACLAKHVAFGAEVLHQVVGDRGRCNNSAPNRYQAATKPGIDLVGVAVGAGDDMAGPHPSASGFDFVSRAVGPNPNDSRFAVDACASVQRQTKQPSVKLCGMETADVLPDEPAMVKVGTDDLALLRA